MELGAKIYGHDHHLKLYESTRAALSSKMQKGLNVSLYASSIG